MNWSMFTGDIRATRALLQGQRLHLLKAFCNSSRSIIRLTGAHENLCRARRRLHQIWRWQTLHWRAQSRHGVRLLSVMLHESLSLRIGTRRPADSSRWCDLRLPDGAHTLDDLSLRSHSEVDRHRGRTGPLSTSTGSRHVGIRTTRELVRPSNHLIFIAGICYTPLRV
jgi:hypothetical protein